MVPSPRACAPTRSGRTALPFTRAAASAVLVAAVLGGCSGGGSDQPAAAGSCPATVVSQLSWFPDPTHAAFLTPLVDPRYAAGSPTVDDTKLAVTGKLRVPGIARPVTWEVRAGGPAKGGSTVADLMYTDRSITLGQQATEEQIAATATRHPTISVLAPLDQDPVGYAWDPTVFPGFHSIADVGMTSTPVLAYRSPSLDYLTGAAILRRSQVDTSYDGSPARLLAADGRLVVAGFSTGLPWTYAHLGRRSRTLEFHYVTDAGYPSYRNLVTIRSADKPALSWCLHRIVPVMQQAQADFMAAPDPTLKLVERLNTAWRNPEPWSFDKGRNAWRVMRHDGLVANGRSGFGAVDLRPGEGLGGGRVRRLIDILEPLYRGQGLKIPDGLTPAVLATNEFLDPRITLPDSK
jgi:hypothetical protein